MTAFLFLLSLGFWDVDPLRQLERATLAVPTWQAVYTPPLGAERKADLDRLQRLVERGLGAKVELIEAAQDGAVSPVAGVTYLDQRLIQLDPALSPNAQLQVLAHEAGHLLSPPDLARAEREVFADAVSYLVTRDAIRIYALYLSQHKSGLTVLRTHRREIHWAADVLSIAIR